MSRKTTTPIGVFSGQLCPENACGVEAGLTLSPPFARAGLARTLIQKG